MKRLQKLLAILMAAVFLLPPMFPQFSQKVYAAAKIPSAYVTTVAKQLVKYGKAGIDAYGQYISAGVQTVDVYDLDNDKTKELIVIRIEEKDGAFDAANLSVWTYQNKKVKQVADQSMTAFRWGSVGIFSYKGKAYVGYTAEERQAVDQNNTNLYHTHYLYSPKASKGKVVREDADAASNVKAVKQYLEYTWSYYADEKAVSEVEAVSKQSAVKTAMLKEGVKATTVKATAAAVKQGQIKVSWKKSKGYAVNYYQVYRKAGKNGKYQKVGTVKDASSFTDKKVKTGTTYYYKVRGVRKLDGKNYCTKWSNAASCKAISAQTAQWKSLYRDYMKQNRDWFLYLLRDSDKDGVPELYDAGLGMSDVSFYRKVYVADGKIKVKTYDEVYMTAPDQKDVGLFGEYEGSITDNQIDEFLNSWK